MAADIPEQGIENLEKSGKIAYIEPDYKINIEPDYEIKALENTIPWGITRIGAPLVHTNGNKGTGINVAIIDTGINYNHPDLQDNYKGGYDFVNGDVDPLDDNGHGTHCAGIIAAADNDVGVIGVAPEANLYSLKMLDSIGSGYTSDLIAAIEWAIETHNDTDSSNDIQIISMSLGSSSGVPALEEACSQAYDSGILLVAAAGNDGNARRNRRFCRLSGSYSSVIAVAATDSTNNRASFSSTGTAVELAAPGVSIYQPIGRLRLLKWDIDGLPSRCRICSIIWAVNPFFTNGNIRDRLAQTATDLGTPGRDNLYGYGLVNAETAAAVSSPDEPAPKIHIENIQVTTSSRSVVKNTLVSATAVVTIQDNAGQPVKGVTVSGHWSGATADTDSAVTGADGTVAVKSNEVKYKNGVLTFTFTVDT